MIVIHLVLTLGIYLIGFLPVWLLGWLMVPAALLFCGRDSEHLPHVFWPWCNCDAGINGIRGGKNPAWLAICGSTAATRSYWRRLQWLAWRNPASNWGRVVLGAVLDEDARAVRGDFGVGNGRQDHAGCLYARSGWRWEHYIVWVWPFAPGRCCRIRFGWKLAGKKAGERATWVFSLLPFKKFEGKFDD